MSSQRGKWAGGVPPKWLRHWRHSPFASSSTSAAIMSSRARTPSGRGAGRSRPSPPPRGGRPPAVRPLDGLAAPTYPVSSCAPSRSLSALRRGLSNPIYVGRIAHKGQVHEGQHPPIVSLELWDEVQQSLRDHTGAARTRRTRQSSDALLAGKLYDDGGNRMSPTWARKGSKRWRYYVSQAALQGDKSKAGSIPRVPAADVETLVAEALGRQSPDRAASQADIREPD